MKEKKKKILFVATVDSHILAFHLPYLKMLQEMGYETHVATNGNAKIPYCNKRHTICMERSPFRLKNLKAISQMKKLMAKEEFDIVHCHTPMGSVVTRLAGKKFRQNGMRVIYTAHGFHFYDGAPMINWVLFYPVEKYLAKYVDTLITINKEDYARAKKKFAKRCKDIRYVPGVGLDTSKFDFEMSEKEKLALRESLGLKKDDFVIIYAARIDKNKNHAFLIDVAKELIPKHPEIQFIFPGRDELNHECQDMVSSLGLESHMHFLGFREDVPKLLKMSDMAVSASRREGLPMNIAEALYMGLPVVALKCRGMEDLIKNGKNGDIITGDALNGFSNRILKRYKQKNEEKKIKLSDEFLMRNVIGIYEMIVKKRKKVLHLLSTSKYSGAENVACQIIRMFENDNNYEMLYCSPEGTIRKAVEEKGIEFIPIDRVSCGGLRRIIEKKQVDIVHAHDIRASVIAGLAKTFGEKIEVISHVHNNHAGMRVVGVKSILYGAMANRFKHIFWVSRPCFNDYIFKNSIKDKSSILCNVIDEREIWDKAQKAEEQEQFDVVFIGRLCDQKDPFRVLGIMEKVIKKDSGVKCAFVGDGEYKRGLERKIEDDGTAQNIQILGFMENPYGILKNAKVFLMASKYEGLPMVVLESAALGVPIVSTSVDGISEIVDNGVNGFLESSNKALVNRILELLNNTELYEKMRKRQRAKSVLANDIAKYKRVLESAYEGNLAATNNNEGAQA